MVETSLCGPSGGDRSRPGPGPYAAWRLAGARGSRTHRPDRGAGANGFEVREAHQDPFAPAPRRCCPWPATPHGAGTSAVGHQKVYIRRHGNGSVSALAPSYFRSMAARPQMFSPTRQTPTATPATLGGRCRLSRAPSGAVTRLPATRARGSAHCELFHWTRARMVTETAPATKNSTKLTVPMAEAGMSALLEQDGRCSKRAKGPAQAIEQAADESHRAQPEGRPGPAARQGGGVPSRHGPRHSDVIAAATHWGRQQRPGQEASQDQQAHEQQHPRDDVAQGLLWQAGHQGRPGYSSGHGGDAHR